MSADSIALLRLVIAEAPRLLEAGHAYYGHGPRHSHAVLTNYLRTQNERGTLVVTDPEEAAFHFMSLLMHPWYLKRLQWLVKPPTPLEVERSVASAISAFMKLYRHA